MRSAWPVHFRARASDALPPKVSPCSCSACLLPLPTAPRSRGAPPSDPPVTTRTRSGDRAEHAVTG